MRRSRNVMNDNFVESAISNDRSFLKYYNRLMELSVSMFEWNNLPETVDPRFLELTLFGKGFALFFEDEVLGYLALSCNIGGRQTVYRIPMDRHAYAPNGYHVDRDNRNSVLIFNNLIHTNAMLAVEDYAKRLWQIDRIIDVNVQAQRTPVLISCDETQRLTMINLYKKYVGNEPFIFADSKLNPQNISVLNTQAPYLANDLQSLKTQIWNEALTYLGISNINNQKRERLITDEVTRSEGGTIASRYSRLEARRQACDEINRMFGLDISVDFRADLRQIQKDEAGSVAVDDETINEDEKEEINE